jgi:uncharacterized protein
VRSHPIPKARYAAILIVILVACIVTFLVACPPSAQAPAGQTQAPQRPQIVTPPATLPQTTQPQGASPSTRPPLVSTGRPEHPQPEKQGMLAVIIDDAGYSLEELQGFLDLPVPLTIAVLPNLPHSREAARRVIASGKDLILHCPMEATGGENPGPGALSTGQSAPEIEALLAQAFASVPGAKGMNNHMGSRATADEALMRVVLGYLRREGMFYIDSRTTAETVGPRVALELGVPFAQRDVFIDVSTSAEEIAAAFAKGVSEAKTRGSAVMIGHVQNKGVLDILRAREQGLSSQDVRLARLADVLQDQERTPAH